MVHAVDAVSVDPGVGNPDCGDVLIVPSRVSRSPLVLARGLYLPLAELLRQASMSYASSTDKRFLATLNEWLQSQREILLLVRYSHAAGSKDFEFFSSFETLAERLRSLPPRTSIIAFRQPHLPIRGIVDDSFITTCLSSIPDGSEFLVAETIRRTAGRASWFHHGAGETHAELREELESLRGHTVAVGLYPPWLEDTDNVISAVVPDEHGVVTTGIY